MNDIKITDALAQTRGLNEFKQLDQAGRIAAARMAADAHAEKLEEQQKEVADAEHSLETKADEEERKKDEQRSRSKRNAAAEEEEEKSKRTPPPEVMEGRILDFKA